MTNEEENMQEQPIPPSGQEPTPEQIPEVPTKAKKEARGKKNKGSDLNVDLSGIREALINYLIPLISVGASILLVVFVLMPAYRSIPELTAQMEENLRLEATLREKLSNMNRLLEFKSVVEENSDLVNKVLVSEELVPGLLTQIDRITRESGMTVNTLNYGLGTSKSNQGKDISYNTVTVNLGTKGSFGQLKSFMNNIEKAARIVVVDNFRYNRSTKDDEDFLSVNFVLISPYLFVQSDAVTDEPIDLDIADPEFQNLINKIKNLKYYDPYDIDENVVVVEAPEETVEEAEEASETTPETTEETTTEETAAQPENPTEEVEESVFGGQ